MTHAATIHLLATGGFTLLVAAGCWLLVLDTYARPVAQRTALVAKAYGPVTAPAASRALRLRGEPARAGTGETLGRLIGLETNRPDLYWMPWWLVLPLMAAVAFVLARAIVFLVGATGWLVLPAAWYFGSRAYFSRGRRRYCDKLIQQMPDALGMIVRTVRAGVPVTEAFQVVATEAAPLTAKEFSILTAEIGVGRPLEEALWRMAIRSGLREYRFLAVALTLQAQTGGSLTETLEKLADVIRKRSALRQRGRALTSEGRATAIVLTILPFLVAAVLFVINPGYISLLVTDPLGKLFLLGAIGSLCGGLVTMRVMIQRSLS